MIFVDDRRIDFTSFPDGTSSIRIAPKLDFTFFAMGKSAYFIRWMYDNDAECMQLWYLVKHLKSAGNPLLYLEMPYIPNARMDRVKNRDEVFTLKWFAEFINSLGFESVKVLDPHSNVMVHEVIQIGYELLLPINLISKTPSDGLCGKTDEDNLGFTYAHLDAYIMYGTSGIEEIDKKIASMHDHNLHKLNPMPAYGTTIF